MNVCLVVRRLGPGGTERQVIELAKALADKQIQVTVIEYYSGGLLSPLLQGVSRVSLICLDKTGRFAGVSFFRKLIQSINQANPDVVMGYLPSVTVPLTIARRLRFFTAPFVMNIRRGEPITEGDRLSFFMMYLEWKLGGFADKLVFNSSHAQAAWRLSAKLRNESLVIPNGIDTDEFQFSESARKKLRAELGIADDEVLIGSVARFDYLKRHVLLIESLKELPENHRIAFISRGGDSKVEADLKEQSREFNSRVLWLEPRREMSSYYSALDVFVLCSASEGFPNVLAEAMACERVCVATDCGDSKQILADSGFLVEPKIESVVDGIKKAAETPELGCKAREGIVHNFGVESLRDKTLSLIEELKK